MLVIEIVAILSCTVFAGAAIYINVAEHPARMECGTDMAATVFGPSYRRAAAMQASLALVATIAGVSLGVNGGSSLWFLGAGIINDLGEFVDAFLHVRVLDGLGFHQLDRQTQSVSQGIL